MSHWDLKEFSQLVEQHCDAGRRPTIQQTADSVVWKLKIAQYHACQSNQLLDEVTPNTVETTKQIFGLAAGKVDSDPFREAAFMSEAHLIASCQALHSTGDIAANLVYQVTAKNLGAIPDHQIDLGRVITHVSGLSQLAEIHKALETLKASDAFAYVNAYVNIIKHRSLLSIRPWVQFQPGPPKHGLRVDEFYYKGVRYPEHWFEDLSGTYRKRIGDSVLAVGRALNVWLR
jgi:hypothetical protein